jgi:16S rRNA (cytosine967-C5)-methyltransferase
MTPAARIQAAIEIVDRIRAGQPAEKVLTNWARASRFAGAKDRAAVRDHVFDVLRKWNSTAILGGGETGRARLIGLLRDADVDPATLFTGQGHSPQPLTPQEQSAGRALRDGEGFDMPDWLADKLTASLAEAAAPTAQALRRRAPVFLRVNLIKSTREAAIQTLMAEGIESRAHELSPSALEVVEGTRKIAHSAAFKTGLVELQDAASQAVVDALPLTPGMRVLDYCAGGGGKSLAMAGRIPDASYLAHDANADRMKDLPARAKRAGARVEIVKHPKGKFDLVLCDVPCSGSGSWRRAPEGKWRLTETGFEDLITLQAKILRQASDLVAPGGTLAYATCSVFEQENSAQAQAFSQAYPAWRFLAQRQFLPADGGDGFYVALWERG